jgi:ABC transporter substrate binding protein (PQQ-dependent alcohol dehydrogenase system)
LFETVGVQANIKQLELDASISFKEQLADVARSGMLILDLPLEAMVEVANISNDMKTVAFNVRHSNTSLRESLCLPYVFHTIPSDGMYFDALGQFLVYRGWRKVLLVKGPSEQDTQRAESLVRSLKKFGTTVVDERTFTLSHHPDDRDENRPDFLTGGVSYDVVAVIDSQKDYGRYLQYSTRSARPVVGDVGLTPASWHFALERYGAPQLNERYRQFKPDALMSPQAAMTDSEFAAWSAVKLITNSLNSRQQTKDVDLHAVLTDPDSQVDLYKGTRGSIRLWNHQLRQPILLAASRAVIAVAPMPKFLHPKHYVDTLGLDKPESDCQLN